MKRSEWEKFKQGFIKQRDNATDAVASEAIYTYPTMHYDGKSIEAGTRIRWGDKLKIATVTLWDREDNDPDHAPSLWEDIEYKEGVRIIPDVITVSKAFSKDEKGWWNNFIYISIVNSNVYNPDQYPPNWRKEA